MSDLEHHDPPGAARAFPDPELAAILPDVVGPGGSFGHRQHVNLAFLAVRRYGMPAAVQKVCAWIRHLTAHDGAPPKYHHTVTRAWVELVAHHIATDPDCDHFDTFAERHPTLMNQHLLTRHYRSTTLATNQARHSWTQPDLTPFPWPA